jgi:hypothetical protein
MMLKTGEFSLLPDNLSLIPGTAYRIFDRTYAELYCQYSAMIRTSSCAVSLIFASNLRKILAYYSCMVIVDDVDAVLPALSVTEYDMER